MSSADQSFGPPLPHKLAAELARVRVAVARARDDLAEGRIPNLADLQSLVAGVCAATVEAARPAAIPGVAPDIIPDIIPGASLAATLETLLAELNALEDEVQKFRDRAAENR